MRFQPGYVPKNKNSIEALWASAEPFDGPLDTPCMLLPRKPKPHGYVDVRIGGKPKKAHRVLYEALVGPVPPGLECDHLCRNRACVNVFEHIEPVPKRINCLRGISPAAQHARKTHCSQGHEFTPENVYIHRRPGSTSRSCRACSRVRGRDRHRRIAAARRAALGGPP